MAIVVQKYGGSSVADVERIGRVADRAMGARRKGDDVVVVVSAMGKATDELLGLAARVAPEPPRRELDMLVSTGERVTMALLSMAIHARGGASISFTGSQSGIITDERHFDARIVEVRPHRVEEELARGNIVVVAGYQGVSRAREVTTLGRGGSDTTAVALAAALGAYRCEIYSDVDGVYSADPRVVPDAVHLPEVGYPVIAEMAEAGAKVLNAQAVGWARRAGVRVHARRTGDDPGRGRETVLRAREGEGEGRANVRAVVGLDRVVQARVAREALRRLTGLAEELGLALMDVAALSSEASCAIPLANVPDWEACRSRIAGELGAAVSFQSGCGVVSLVGEGLTAGTGVLGGVIDLLETIGAPAHALHASALRVGATIDAGKLRDAQRALHSAFTGRREPRAPHPSKP
jgi:aspartate kinase